MFLTLLERLLKLQQLSQVIPASELTDIIRKGIKIPQVRLYTRRSPVVDFDTISVGGLYDSYLDREGEPCIELSIVYHPDQQHIDLAKLNWAQVCFDVAECVGHEFVPGNNINARSEYASTRARTLTLPNVQNKNTLVPVMRSKPTVLPLPQSWQNGTTVLNLIKLN